MRLMQVAGACPRCAAGRERLPAPPCALWRGISGIPDRRAGHHAPSSGPAARVGPRGGDKHMRVVVVPKEP